MAARSPMSLCIDEAVLGRELDLTKMVNINLGSARERKVEVLEFGGRINVVAVDAEDVVDALLHPFLRDSVSLELLFYEEPPWGESTEERICVVLATHPFHSFVLGFGTADWDDITVLNACRRSLCHLLEALSKNAYLVSLSLRILMPTGKDDQTSTPSLETIALPRSLKSLAISDSSKQAVLSLIKVLETNTTVTSLSLIHYSHKQELYEALIDLLSVNFTLKELDLSDTVLAGDHGCISTITSMMQDEDASKALALLHSYPKMQPTSARVFFCGNGRAGKTTLQKTFVNLMDANVINMVRQQLKSSVGKLGKQPGKTAGIDVTKLNNRDIKISLWDLAGQKEYHAFHDLMFPHEQGPSFFLIACCLIDTYDQDKALESTSPKPLEDIAAELRYWLRYLSSNTRKTRVVHITFVFTHNDKLCSPEIATITKDRIEALKEGLEKEFDSLVRVLGSPFFVDGRKPKAVHSLLEHTIREVREITSNCQPIFSVCKDAEQWISNWMKNHPQEPWMNKNDFIKLCSKELYDSKNSARHRTEAVGIADAILFDLHRMGNLIHFKDQGIVLVNVPWFCKAFMGRILEQTTQVSLCSSTADEKLGVWKRDDIKRMLERLCNIERIPSRSYKSTAVQLDGDQLIDIMMQLEFCFAVDSGSNIYIPATLRGSGWQTNRRWAAEVEKPDCEFGYVGRRLQCEDSKRTFLTPGFFPRLQVHLRNVLKSSQYVLEKDFIKIVDDRMEILIEFNEAPASFIDIMVRFSRSKHLDHVLDFVRQKVIQSTRDLQRKSGCWQGVYLIELALRPSCVRKLVVREMKQKQCVSLEELSAHVLQANLVDDIENITYAWSSLECASLGEEYSPIIELTGERCFSGIISERLMKVEELSEHLGLFRGDASSCHTSRNRRGPTEELPESSLIKEDIPSHMGLESQMNRVEAKIDAIAKDISGVKGAIGRLLDGIIPEVHRLLTEVCNLDGEGNARLPQLFLFKEDKTLVSKLVPGLRNLRLTFMCENYPMPHLPSGQEGIQVSILEEGALRTIQPYLNFLLSALALGFQLGAPMARAHGIVVPNWSSMIDGLLLKSQGLHDRSWLFPKDGSRAFNGGKQLGVDPVILQKARIWVLHCLREKECNNEPQILVKFGLMRKQGRDGRCLWLCEDHYRQAI